MNKPFKKILIANRGEIACRIIRSCQQMGIKTVAVFSEADAEALHVKQADESVCIGPAAPQESYLNIPKLIEAAQNSGAEAIHPGYGFLSENAAFARACAKAKITFIGPRADTIENMGDKITAKRAVEANQVPTVPSSLEILNTDNVSGIADKIVYPVLLKASAGGGGKGMRVVEEPADLVSSLEGAMREAKGAFGDDRVFMEKFVDKPRHIEIQVIADEAGNTMHLFERDCSAQRRHQKIIEESPSPRLTPELREAMGQAAVAAAEAANYVNAGTVEFLFDQDENFYFLEMNTRLQVEHPVTECVSGLDLVRWQLNIAAGENLWPQMRPDNPRGHAIELRIYAEDPGNNFLPAAGSIKVLSEPSGPGIRVDSCLYQGWDVPVFYDPMLAKLIVWDETRTKAIQKAMEALQNYRIDGIQTNIEFLKEVLSHPDFVHGDIDTGWVEREFSDWAPGELKLDPYDLFNPWIPREQGAALKRREAFKKDHSTGQAEDLSGPISIEAPMPGKIIQVNAKGGDEIKAGETLVILEAMKMEHSLSCPRDGKITQIHCEADAQVGMGELLIEIE